MWQEVSVRSRVILVVAYVCSNVFVTSGCQGDPPSPEYHFSIPITADVHPPGIDIDEEAEGGAAKIYTTGIRSGWADDVPSRPHTGGAHIYSAGLDPLENDGDQLQFAFDTHNYANGAYMTLAPGKYTMDVYVTYQWPTGTQVAHLHSVQIELLGDGTVVDENGNPFDADGTGGDGTGDDGTGDDGTGDDGTGDDGGYWSDEDAQ